MAFVAPQRGDQIILAAIAAYASSSWMASLYKNSHAPSNVDVLTNYTAASDMTQNIPGWPNYATPTNDGAGTGYMTHSAFTFALTANTAQTIYGWYVVDGGTSVVIAEQFATPLAIGTSGDQVRISNHTFKCHS